MAKYGHSGLAAKSWSNSEDSGAKTWPIRLKTNFWPITDRKENLANFRFRLQNLANPVFRSNLDQFGFSGKLGQFGRSSWPDLAQLGSSGQMVKRVRGPETESLWPNCQVL